MIARQSLFETDDNRHKPPAAPIAGGKDLRCPGCKGILSSHTPDRCPNCLQQISREVKK